jgi:hypothetical protein
MQNVIAYALESEGLNPSTKAGVIGVSWNVVPPP